MGLDAIVYADDMHEKQLGHVRIGNVANVAGLRDEVEKFAGQFPLLMNNVIYNGTHCGDTITAGLVGNLKAELIRLPAGSNDLNKFKADMIGLCEMALKHNRPIDF